MAAKGDVYVALDSFSYDAKSGVTYNIGKGQRFQANHPAVKHAPHLFEIGSPYDYELESATAAPGEKRA